MQRFDIEDEQRLQWGEQRAREVHVVKGEMILHPCLKGRGPFIDHMLQRSDTFMAHGALTE
jgi:hypothetical protein